jgi:hypothetical protein
MGSKMNRLPFSIFDRKSKMDRPPIFDFRSKIENGPLQEPLFPKKTQPNQPTPPNPPKEAKAKGEKKASTGDDPMEEG